MFSFKMLSLDREGQKPETQQLCLFVYFFFTEASLHSFVMRHLGLHSFSEKNTLLGLAKSLSLLLRLPHFPVSRRRRASLNAACGVSADGD